MSRSHKVQVTLNEVEYAADPPAAPRRRAGSTRAVVREAIQEYCVKPDKRRRQREALEALRSMPPAPVPESWSEWKREYSRLKTKFLPTDPPDLRDTFAAESSHPSESDDDR